MQNGGADDGTGNMALSYRGKTSVEGKIECIKKGTSGESYNLMAKLAVLRYNAIIPTG